MKKFELTYNPFTHERAFLADGKPAELSNCWGDDDSKELSEWCGDFFQALKDKFNNSEMEVHFKGILRDWEFLLDAKEKYCAENPSDCIRLVDNGCTNTSAKKGELEKLFREMQSDSPFQELKDPKLKDLFDKAMSSEFEMAVVATMSSGKSTLINAMLGCELLPALNEATTATLAKIYDSDGFQGFKGMSKDANGNKLETREPLTLNDMKELNGKSDTAIIEIKGDIIGVESKDMQLVLTDTPGPNNSREKEGESHRNHTFELLEAEYKPMILYVLDGTKPEVNDDANLLDEVAAKMKSGGRQSRERFIFVLNKADEFDPEKGESASKKVKDFETYLAVHDIRDARIFPVSARMAKVIRQHLGGQEMSLFEKRKVLSTYEYYIEDLSQHFSDFAPLSPSARRKLDADLADARKKDDRYREALIYTGVPAIELAISEYLAKYALPAKIAEGVSSFKSKITSLGIQEKAKAKLEGDEKEVAKIKEEVSKLKSLIEKGEKAKELRAKIDDFSSQKSISEKLKKAREEFNRKFIPFIESKKNLKSVSAQDAADWNRTLNEKLQNATGKFKVDVEKALSETIKRQAEKAVGEYKAYLGALVEDVDHELKPENFFGAAANISVEESLDSFTKDEVVGYHKEKQDGIGGSIKRFFGSVFEADWGYNIVADHGDRVDFAAYLEDNVLPKVEEFFISARKLVEEKAQEEEREFKEFYKRKLVELDKAIKAKLADMEEALSSQDNIERMIAENKRNLAWLADFQRKLDNVLSL